MKDIQHLSWYNGDCMGKYPNAEEKLAALLKESAGEPDSTKEYDEEFLKLYDDILVEAENLGNKPPKYTYFGISRPLEEKKKIIHIESILSEDNDTFINNIYRKILGREADKGGYDNLNKRLSSESDTDKEQIVLDYWKSAEGKKRNIEVVGFKKIYMDDLLSFNREAFVEHCFLQIFARKPHDNDLKTYYEAIYLNNMSKEEVIRILKDSDEGKRRNVEIIGFDEAYKKRKKMESRIAKPFWGNLYLTFLNVAHINKRIKEIEDRTEEIKNIYDKKIRNLEDQLKYCEMKNKFLSNSLTDKVDRLLELNVSEDFLEKLNLELSGRMTVWGDKKRLHISPKASVYTCLFNTNSGEITIGDYTFAGSKVSVLAGSHDKNLTGLPRRDAEETEGFDIVIGNGVWLGSNSTILGPCTIGDNAVVAAGAVVAPGTVIPSNTVYGGVPAKQISVIPQSGEYSDSIIRALKRNDGILFTEGWSERRSFSFRGKELMGYYLYDSVGKVLINNGLYKILYTYLLDEPISLSIDTGNEIQKHVLNSKEGIIDIDIKADEGDFRYISFGTDTIREDLSIKIIKSE